MTESTRKTKTKRLPRSTNDSIKNAIRTLKQRAIVGGRTAIYWLGHHEFKVAALGTAQGEATAKRVATLGGHLVGVYTREAGLFDVLGDIEFTLSTAAV